ncbi:MobP3 family relaxase (plasmid) [Oscillospiraceae bacterium MB08-C2-2]|nr:MobP3 family relaxase [Oscillospiraceae bacterium MB08-C2-2]
MSSPKLICKSGYLKDITHFFNVLNYAGNKIDRQRIAFTDGTTLEVPADQKIVLTTGQQDSVAAIQLDFKDGGSKRITYEAYSKLTEAKTTTVTVQELETVQDDALLVNTDGKQYHKTEDLDFFRYLGYIEGRPGVEKSDGHGLFGLTGDIPVSEAEELGEQYHDSRKWSHILSLDEGDALRTGFNQRHMWAALVRNKAPVIAKAYNISLENMVINCAYHGNTDNPHVHLLFYSKDPNEGFVKGGKEGMLAATEKLKSTLHNSIFKDDTAALKKEKTLTRDALRDRIKQSLGNLAAKDYSQTELGEKLFALSSDLADLSGKMQYEYLPPAVKVKTDDILRWIIEKDSDMQALYENYLGIQGEMIAQYVADPAKVQKKLEDFAGRFFAPGKGDLKLYHNVIVQAAVSVGDFSPPENVASGEEKNGHSPTVGGELSSGNNDDIPMPGDWDAPPEREFFPGPEIEPAAKEEKSDSPMPPPEVSTGWEDFSFSPEDIPPEREVFYFPEIVPAAKERKKELATQRLELLAGNEQPSYKAMAEFLKDQHGCLNNKAFSKAYRKTLSGIFNPKIPNTSLQESVLGEMEQLRSFEKKEQYSPACKNHIRNVFGMLSSTDGELANSIEAMFEASEAALVNEFGRVATKEYLENFRQNMHSLERTNEAHSYITYFAQTLEDQQYYQLLEAFSEFNRPLNKALYKGFRNLYDDKKNRNELLDVLREIQTISPYLEDDEVNTKVCELVKPLFGTLVQDPEVSPAFEEYKANYGEVLDTYMPEHAVEYKKRLDRTLREVKRLMRPHFSIVQFSKNYEQFVYDQITRDREIHKELNNSLYSSLRQCLTDQDTFSSLLVRRELEQYASTQDQKHLAAVFQYLYNTHQSFHTLVDDTTEAVYRRLKGEMGAEVARTWIEQYKKALFSAESSLSMYWSMGRFANTLSEQYYRQIPSKHKEIMGTLYKAMRYRLGQGLNDSEILAQLQELQKALKEETPDQEQCAKLASALLSGISNDGINNLMNVAKSNWEQAIGQYCDDPNRAMELLHRVEHDFYHGDGPIRSFIENFAKDLQTNQAKHVFDEMKDFLKEYRSALFKELRHAVIYHKKAIEPLLEAVLKKPKDVKALDDLLATLSTKSVNLLQWRDTLCADFSYRMGQKGFVYPAEEFQELFDRFFYACGENKYDTIYVRETVGNVHEKMDEIICDFYSYRMKAACNSLIYGLGALLATQADTARSGAPEQKHKRKHPFIHQRRKRKNISTQYEY